MTKNNQKYSVNDKSKRTRSSKNKGKNGHKIKKILLILTKIIFTIAIIAGIIAFLFISPVFNISEIKVENAQKISENTYIALSEIQIGENIFKINKLKIKKQIEKEPYVEKVEIKREFPKTVLIDVIEREPEYMAEKNGIYIYIDKNGYTLEENSEKMNIPILKGTKTDFDNIEIGERISDSDLSKFNDLIKIIDGLENNNIEVKISNIDISDYDNYILDFEEEGKKVILGDILNLSTKMLWIKYFLEQKSGERGTIHLNTENVYFTPEN